MASKKIRDRRATQAAVYLRSAHHKPDTIFYPPLSRDIPFTHFQLASLLRF
jgi:hypothetical protein